MKQLLDQLGRLEHEPQQAAGVMKGLLKAVQNYNPPAFGSEEEQPLYRMAVLAEIRNLFSQPQFADALAAIDPDRCVNASLLEDDGIDDNGNGKLIKPAYRIKPPFCNDRYTHKFVDEWYAERRYAIGIYGSIVVQLPSAEAREPKVPPNSFHRFIGRCFSQGEITDALILLILLLGWRWVGAIYPLTLLIAIGVWGYLWYTRGAHVLEAMVPRLAACAIVGLVLPLATEEVWKLSFRLWEHRLLFWFLAGVLLIASWLYLFVETHNHVGKSWLSAYRASHILLRLCNFALFFSWWATMMVAVLRPAFIVQSVPTVFGLQTVPTPCLLFAAFAVFIGIFLQILWHERPITSRL